MEFTNEFRVPATPKSTFELLTDLERIGSCMPGATIEDVVDGTTATGRMQVRVGPIQVKYAGTAEITEKDREALTAAIAATGREARGGGSASADVVAKLRPDGDETVVTVVSRIDVTGKAAQFGRGVMADVGERIVDQFAVHLRDMLSQPDAWTTADGSLQRIAPAPAASLDLLEVAGATVAKRFVPVAIALLAIAYLLRRHR